MPLFACFLRWYRCVPCTDALCQRIGRVRAIYFSFCACISTSVSAFVSVWFAPGIQQVSNRDFCLLDPDLFIGTVEKSRVQAFHFCKSL